MSNVPQAFGKYQVAEVIGSGGFGTVYRAVDPTLDRFVAVKACAPGDPEIRQRFTREAKIVAALRHPNLVTVYDYGFEGESPYLVQELLGGADLDELLRRRALDDDEKVAILLQIARGLEYAHSHQVVHRDIKPSNVRVLEDGQVKILDFGIARVMDGQTRLTRTGSTVGSANYMAPEQVSGQPADHRADVFAFGVLAYEMFALQTPFRGDAASVLFQIIYQAPEPLERVCATCPPPVVRCVERCLEKEPEDRYSSFSEVIRELGGAPALMPGQQPVRVPVLPRGPGDGGGQDARSWRSVSSRVFTAITPRRAAVGGFLVLAGLLSSTLLFAGRAQAPDPQPPSAWPPVTAEAALPAAAPAAHQEVKAQEPRPSAQAAAPPNPLVVVAEDFQVAGLLAERLRPRFGGVRLFRSLAEVGAAEKALVVTSTVERTGGRAYDLQLSGCECRLNGQIIELASSSSTFSRSHSARAPDCPSAMERAADALAASFLAEIDGHASRPSTTAAVIELTGEGDLRLLAPDIADIMGVRDLTVVNDRLLRLEVEGLVRDVARRLDAQPQVQVTKLEETHIHVRLQEPPSRGF